MTSWSLVTESLRRPYRVTIPMILLVLLVPLYIFIPEFLPPGRTLHAPELALDRAIPLQPVWAHVYGALYLFLILLPVFTIRQQELIRRTVWAYLFVWLTAYVFFVVYPTVAPRPSQVSGDGFIAWGLRFLYAADTPHNCFPSLHVAHSFVSAFATYRLHRRLGVVAMLFAALVGLSTLFTKQHYVLDVVAGFVLASIAYLVFLRRYDDAPEFDRQAAPALAVSILGVIGLLYAGYWLAYRLT